MTELQGTTTIGTSIALQEATVQAFKTSLRGALLCPGDAGYDAARTVYNAMIDRRPALIARCAGAADVMAGVQFAPHTICWCLSVAAGTTWLGTPSATAADAGSLAHAGHPC